MQQSQNLYNFNQEYSGSVITQASDKSNLNLHKSHIIDASKNNIVRDDTWDDPDFLGFEKNVSRTNKNIYKVNAILDLNYLS
jgi:hypothetical protein